MKVKIKSYELLDSRESSGAFLANHIKDLGRKYNSYLS